mmetsp:Transcript_38661/g.75958  ORF Transcript_38661/g.75958 Transcript_38661/m.75958 type:complete len:165 (-) Transcript_38661:630-1124(-)
MSAILARSGLLIFPNPDIQVVESLNGVLHPANVFSAILKEEVNNMSEAMRPSQPWPLLHQDLACCFAYRGTVCHHLDDTTRTKFPLHSCNALFKLVYEPICSLCDFCRENVSDVLMAAKKLTTGQRDRSDHPSVRTVHFLCKTSTWMILEVSLSLKEWVLFKRL